MFHASDVEIITVQPSGLLHCRFEIASTRHKGGKIVLTPLSRHRTRGKRAGPISIGSYLYVHSNGCGFIACASSAHLMGSKFKVRPVKDKRSVTASFSSVYIDCGPIGISSPRLATHFNS